VLAPAKSTWILVAFAAAAALGGCRDREQQASIDGASARTEVAATCASATADAGEPADARMLCVQDRCRERCGAYAGTKTFGQTCLDACSAVGACNTDADCAAGLRCIAIAPVVRRCTPPR